MAQESHCSPSNVENALYIQPAPSNYVPPDALSTVTYTDTSSVIPNTTFVIQRKPSNQGEINSQWIYDDIIYCDTVVHATNIAQVALLNAVSHSHHLFDYPQDGDITGELPDELNTFHVFDTACIYKVDNFNIHIDLFKIQSKDVHKSQQDLLPVSLFIPIYIQGIPIQQVLTVLFDSGGAISLIYACVISMEVIPTIGNNQIFTTLAGKFHSNQQVLLQEIVLPKFKHTAYTDK